MYVMLGTILASVIQLISSIIVALITTFGKGKGTS